MATRWVATGETTDRLTVEDYHILLNRLERLTYTPQQAAHHRARLATDAGTRFRVYGTALGSGLIERVREG
jgi:hypothetical protein